MAILPGTSVPTKTSTHNKTDHSFFLDWSEWNSSACPRDSHTYYPVVWIRFLFVGISAFRRPSLLHAKWRPSIPLTPQATPCASCNNCRSAGTPTMSTSQDIHTRLDGRSHLRRRRALGARWSAWKERQFCGTGRPPSPHYPHMGERLTSCIPPPLHATPEGGVSPCCGETSSRKEVFT